MFKQKVEADSCEGIVSGEGEYGDGVSYEEELDNLVGVMLFASDRNDIKSAGAEKSFVSIDETLIKDMESESEFVGDTSGLIEVVNDVDDDEEVENEKVKGDSDDMDDDEADVAVVVYRDGENDNVGEDNETIDDDLQKTSSIGTGLILEAVYISVVIVLVDVEVVVVVEMIGDVEVIVGGNGAGDVETNGVVTNEMPCMDVEMEEIVCDLT